MDSGYAAHMSEMTSESENRSADVKATAASESEEGVRLWNRGFIGLMVTQISGATNDNLLKAILLVVMVDSTRPEWFELMGPGSTGWISFAFSAPFVLLLGYAGQIADRYPKNRVVVATRIAEVPIAILAMVGFMLNSPWLVIAAFLLLSTESAFFSPSKYGVIREYVGRAELSRANGFINGTTNIAIIAGTAIGGYLLTVGMGGAGLVLVIMALIGLVSSWLMPYTPAINPTLRLSLNPFQSYIAGIRSMREVAHDHKGRSVLWTSVLAWAAFFMFAIVLLNIIPQYKEPMGLTEGQTSTLLAAVGIGIGVGCVGAAMLSGKKIKLMFVPLGGFVMGLAIIALALVTLSGWKLPLWFAWMSLILIGVAGGFFLVPLQAVQQALAKSTFRARVVGTANALSFVYIALGSAGQALLMQVPGITAFHMMLGCGIGMLLLVVWIMTWGRGMFSYPIDRQAEDEDVELEGAY